MQPLVPTDIYSCIRCVLEVPGTSLGTYGRRQNKLCVPFRLNAASYFLPTEKKLNRNGTEQNGTCEKTERTKCVDLNVFYQSTERFG